MSSSPLTSLPTILFLSLLALLMIASSSSALPIDDNSESDPDQGTALLEKFLELENRLRGLRRETDMEAGVFNPTSGGASRKRSGSPRSNRSGGMSLCLWKVCPAAPWLINK
ncbi:hypothetical protein BsWGS_26772 [Bradybaena similaris]